MTFWNIRTAACLIALSMLPCTIAVASAQESKPLAFQTASVRPAAPGAHPEGLDWMLPGIGKVPPPPGLLTMTAPAAAFLTFALNISEIGQMNPTVDKLPDWTRSRMYTIVARPEGSAGLEEVRAMTRTLLIERFALKTHEDSKEMAVNKLVLIKPGVLGPQIKPHAAGEACVPQTGGVKFSKAPEPGSHETPKCGLTLYRLPDGIFHLGLVDVSMADASKLIGGVGGMAGGLALRSTVDGTGLIGTYDMSLEFHPEIGGPSAAPGAEDTGGGPTLTKALEKQLGMKLEKSTGTVRIITIDNIAEPTTD